MKKSVHRLWVPALLMTFLPAAADTVVEEIVVRINNEIVTRSELQRAREQLQAELQQQYGATSGQQFAEREKDVLRDLIDQSLLIQRGKDLGLTADVELVKRLDEIRKQLNLETLEDLERAAAAQGVSYEDFKENVRGNIITQQVIGRDVGGRIQITQEEARAYYEEHKSEFEKPEQIRLGEILVSTQSSNPAGGLSDPAPAPDPQELAEAEQKARDLLAQIRGGASFEEVAKKSSDGPTAAQGGDLGFFKRGVLAAELENTTFAMKVGDVSDVTRTRQGFILLKVTEHHAAGIPPLKEIEPQIMERIYFSKLQPALRAYLTRLREQAYIDIKEGYVDSGASPNQTKPIITTAADIELQKKKKKKRFLLF
ncbi:MAG: peptidylprolyl isomerase [Acidobacteria bacterium]|nr:peptidylprolyl isomerase [Acidobacteriota bacterium]